MSFSSGIAGSRRLRTMLAVLAAANLALALYIIATQPQRALDLLAVREWTVDWLRRGLDVFASRPGVDSVPDYPPNALVTFAPLALIPSRWIVAVWTVVALALSPALPLVVSRAAGIRDRAFTMTAVLAFLCWAAARTMLQFSVLSMTLAFAALAIADAHAVAAGVLLGLALAKPHIAGPVALWAVLAGRTRLVAAAAATIAVEGGIYCARAGVPPVTLINEYWLGLLDTYGGSRGLLGVTSLRAWIPSDAAWIAIALVLLLLSIWTSMRWRNGSGADRLIGSALFSLWSLLAFYHNSNNLILVLPAFVLFAAIGRRWTVLALQLLLMIDVPYRLAPLAGTRVIHALVSNTNRLLVLATFVCLIRTAWARKTV